MQQARPGRQPSPGQPSPASRPWLAHATALPYHRPSWQPDRRARQLQVLLALRHRRGRQLGARGVRSGTRRAAVRGERKDGAHAVQGCQDAGCRSARLTLASQPRTLPLHRRGGARTCAAWWSTCASGTACSTSTAGTVRAACQWVQGSARGTGQRLASAAAPRAPAAVAAAPLPLAAAARAPLQCRNPPNPQPPPLCAQACLPTGAACRTPSPP